MPNIESDPLPVVVTSSNWPELQELIWRLDDALDCIGQGFPEVAGWQVERVVAKLRDWEIK